MQPLEGIGLEAGEPRGHRPAGRPVGPDPGRLLHGRHHGRHPRRLGEGVLERGHPPRGQRWRVGRAGRVVETAGSRLDVGRQPRPRRLLGRDPLGDLALQVGNPGAGAGAGRQDRDLVEPVAVQQPPDVGDHRVASGLRHGVDVVEHHQHDVLVGGERSEVAVVDRGVGVLLRIEDPHEQVRQLHQPVHLQVVGDLGGVVVRQVEEYDAVQRAVLAARVEHRVAGDPVPRGDVEPVEQVRGVVGTPDTGRRPGRGRAAHPDRGELQSRQRVEGRGLARAGGTGDGDDRVVGGETQPPAARSVTPWTSSTRSSSSRPRAASAADRRPSMRTPRSEPRATSFRAPSSSAVIRAPCRRSAGRPPGGPRCAGRRGHRSTRPRCRGGR